MLERFYKYRVTCDERGCHETHVYETTQKKALPPGWGHYHLDCRYDSDIDWDLCPVHWQELCAREIASNPGNTYYEDCRDRGRLNG